MDEKKVIEFYDYLIEAIGSESRYISYDYIYDMARDDYQKALFPNDDERGYQFQQFFEQDIEILSQDIGAVSIQYVIGKDGRKRPSELRLTLKGMEIRKKGGYSIYMKELKREADLAAQREKEEREHEKAVANEERIERRTNIGNNILGMILSIGAFWGMLTSPTGIVHDIAYLTVGFLLGVGLYGLIQNRCRKQNKRDL